MTYSLSYSTHKHTDTHWNRQRFALPPNDSNVTNRRGRGETGQNCSVDGSGGGLMKRFPSRQLFVVSEPGTSCQIRFSSPSRLCTVVITCTSTRVPSDRNRCACLQLGACVCVFLLFSCKRNGRNRNFGDPHYKSLCKPSFGLSRGHYRHRKGNVGSFGVVSSSNVIVTQEERNVFIIAPPVLRLCNNTKIELNATDSNNTDTQGPQPHRTSTIGPVSWAHTSKPCSDLSAHLRTHTLIVPPWSHNFASL